MRLGFRKDGYTHGYKPKEKSSLAQWIKDHRDAKAERKQKRQAIKESKQKQKIINHIKEKNDD